MQYLYNISKKEVRKGVDFLHADEHQSFYKLGILFLLEMARYVQSTQNSKLVMFLQRVLQHFGVLLWCKTFRYFTGVQPCLLLLVSSHSQTRNFLPYQALWYKQFHPQSYKKVPPYRNWKSISSLWWKNKSGHPP